MENGTQAVEQLKSEGYQNLEAIQIDVTDSNSIVEAKNKIEKHSSHLDILINNAGISGVLPQNASNAHIDDIRKTFDTIFLELLMSPRLFSIY